MKIAVAGGGPAGLYFSLLAAGRGGHQVTVFERNPPGATYGWGVVFSEGTLSELEGIDPRVSRRLDSALIRWSTIFIHQQEVETKAGGQHFAAVSRRTLLQLLADAASAAGAEVRFTSEIKPGEVDDYDLVVAADGVNSIWRRHYTDQFEPSESIHPTRYIWLGLTRRLPGFTFIFQPTPSGLFWVHAYPYEAQSSTFIVETTEQAWQKAGLDQADEEASLAFSGGTFASHLDGAALHSNRSQWLRFVTLRTRRWFRGGSPPVVLIGDAAHTAHFSIGSGTKLAMEDAAALAEALLLHPTDLDAALTTYEAVRRPPVERFQEAALDSARYFEQVENLVGLDAPTFAFNLLTRSGRVSYLDLQRQSPDLVGHAISPAFTPIRLRGHTLPHRLLGGSFGLSLSPPLAVQASGVRSRGDPLASDYREQVEVVVLTHAGPRADNRPATDGLDRSLPGATPPLAASPQSYTRRHPLAREATPSELDDVVGAFAAAAEQWRGRARILLLDGAGGNLLASFLSPMTNHRRDGYGGTVTSRLRFPLEVVAATRAVWEGPLGFRFSATDWLPAGITEEDATMIARALVAAGADFVEVGGGGATAEFDPPYRPGYLVPLAAQIRNRASVPVLVGGGIFTVDQANTIIAAGRADLVRMSS